MCIIEEETFLHIYALCAVNLWLEYNIALRKKCENLIEAKREFGDLTADKSAPAVLRTL